MPLNHRVSAALTIASILCWSASLLLPAVDMGPVTVMGWQFLTQGWRGIPALNIGGLSWLANPLLVAAWLAFFLLAKRRPTMILASGALAAALTSPLFNIVNSDQGSLAIEAFAMGFYIWLASTALQTAASALCWWEAKRV